MEQGLKSEHSAEDDDDDQLEKPPVRFRPPPLESLIYQRGIERERVAEQAVEKASEVDDDDDEDDEDEDQLAPIAPADQAQPGEEAGLENNGEEVMLQSDSANPTQPAAPAQPLKPIEPLHIPAEGHAEQKEDPFSKFLRKAGIGEEEPAPTPTPVTPPTEYLQASPPVEAAAPPPAAAEAPPTGPPVPPPEVRAGYGPGPFGPNPFEVHHNLSGPSAGMRTVERIVPDPDTAYYAEQAGTRRGLAAGLITGLLIARYLHNRKMKRFEAAANKREEKQEQQITNLTAEQYALQEQLRRQREAAERARHLQQQQLVEAQQGAAIPPGAETTTMAERLWPTREQHKQHVEQSAWHNVMVDEHGQEVQGAINYGEAFLRERKAEQAGTLQANYGSRRHRGGAYPIPPAGPAGAPMLGGQVDANQLPLGHPMRADSQQVTPVPQNPIKQAIFNPWVWLMSSILLLTFFIVAFI